MVLTNLIVTGASGMVNRHLTDVMCQNKINNVLLSRKKPTILPNCSDWIFFDLEEWHRTEHYQGILDSADAIVHIGAFVPNHSNDPDNFKKIFDINVRSCIYLSKMALDRDIPLLFLSGATVYEDVYGIDICEDENKTSGGFGNFYGYSKLMAEQTLQFFVSQGLKLIILRPSSIYGYGLPKEKMITRFLLTANEDQLIRLYPPIKKRINLIHAQDVALAIINALKREAWGEFNIAGESYSILEISKACINCVGSGSVEIIKEIYTEKQTCLFDLNCEKAKKEFQFTTIIRLNAGIEKMWCEMQKRKI